MPERRPPPAHAEFVYWERATTRWADIDVYGHMNNARYFEIIDTVVNNHLVSATGVDIRELDAIGVVAEVGCRYFAEVGYPDPVDVGLVVDRLGERSVSYRVGLFQGDGDRAAAEGRFIHVYVDNTRPDRPTTAVPERIRAALASVTRAVPPEV
ncbi:MAG: acyl-CoA thioesterase [Marmoricola sp.]